MKKVILLFSLFFTVGLSRILAQTNGDMSVKQIWQPIISDSLNYSHEAAPAVITFASNKHKPRKTQVKSVAVEVTLPVKDSVTIVADQKAMAYADSLQLVTMLVTRDILKTTLYRKPRVKVDTTFHPFKNTVSNRDLQATLMAKITPNMELLKQQFATVVRDSMRAVIPQEMPGTINILNRQIALVLKDSVRASLYQTIANGYLCYDSISIRKTKLQFEDNALDYTMKALHSWSKANNLNGLFTSYSNLSKIYNDQHKMPQAKWFILQANTIARNHRDAPHIVSTLISLAGIKMTIKDYQLAQGDLNEALTIAALNKSPQMESNIQQSLALLYAKMDDPKKSAAALKRHNAIEDSIAKAAQAKVLAAAKAQDSTALAKKKLLTSASKKSSKTNLTAKTVSL